LGPEDEVPPLGEFWEYGNRCYRMEEFYSCEISTLTELNWNLTSLAPIHFMEFYLSQQVIFENDKIHGTEIVDEVIEYYSKYAEFFVDLCMQEYSFQEFRPSQIAASILATSRKVLGMRYVFYFCRSNDSTLDNLMHFSYLIVHSGEKNLKHSQDIQKSKWNLALVSFGLITWQHSARTRRKKYLLPVLQLLYSILSPFAQ
jgi:hypothetical protein